MLEKSCFVQPIIACQMPSAVRAVTRRAATCSTAEYEKPRHFAARPPESRVFQKDRDSLEKRAGRWLKQLSAQYQPPAFDLEKFITQWGEDRAGSRTIWRN